MSQIKAACAPRLNAAIRKAFLAHLAETANVSASARVVHVGTSSIYAERRRSPDFRAEWTNALSEGYARLEADMLSDALVKASAKTCDAMLKSRTQKDRLRLALLSMHRTAVKAAPVPVPAVIAPEGKGLKDQLLAKLHEMRRGRNTKDASAPANGSADTDHG